MPGDSKCPNECTLMKLEVMVERLRDRVTNESGQSCAPKRIQDHKDVCCDTTWKYNQKQKYKVTVDGQVVGPYGSKLAVVHQVYCPPCELRHQEMDPSHGCYNPGGGRGEGANLHCSTGGASKKPAYFPMAKPGFCSAVNAFSVCSGRECPPGHQHWSPECTDCRYPNACRADCFKHPAYKDWIYRQPSYRCFLQKRDDRPFMPGY